MNSKAFPYILLIPGLTLFGVFVGIPIIYTITGSFMFHGTPSFLSNVSRLLTDKLFLVSIWNTIVILLFYLMLKLPFSFLLAYFVSKLSKGKRLMLTIVFIPTTIGGFAYGVIFRFMFSNGGIVTSFLSNFGMSAQFLSNPILVKFIIALSLFITTFGSTTLLFLLAMQNNISKELEDLSVLDGVSIFKRFRKIYVPLLRPIVNLVVLFSVLETIALIDVPMQLTQGGPNNATVTIGYYIYKSVFEYGQYSYGTFLSFITAITILIIMFYPKKNRQRGYHYEDF